MKITDKEVIAAEGCMVHDKVADVYGCRMTRRSNSTEDDYEEVAVEDVPKFSKEEHSAEVERLIAERYTTGQEIQFAREGGTATGFADYIAYVEQCKVQARENLNRQAAEDAKRFTELMKDYEDTLQE